MCGGVKWNSTILQASSVRRPVRAGSCGLRAAAPAFAEAGARTSRVSRASVTLSSLEEDGAGRGCGRFGVRLGLLEGESAGVGGAAGRVGVEWAGILEIYVGEGGRGGIEEAHE